MQLRVRSFRAINEPETCERFIQEHRNVLRDYGITNVTTNNQDWMRNENVYCVVAESVLDDKIVGGIRVQVADEKSPLPISRAIGKMDSRIYNIIEEFKNKGGIGELCALWNAKSVAGIGLSILMVRAGIAMSNQLVINTLIIICADYTLKMFQQVGFVVDNTLGINGGFPYPNAAYTARVLGIMNPKSLENAAEYDKNRMESLRKNPVQVYDEKGINQDIKIEYNLVIAK